MKKDKENKEDKKEYRVDNEIKTDNLLKETTGQYLRLIGDADRKSRIMIIVNSILLTGGVTILTKVIHIAPHVWMAAVILIGFNLVSLFFTLTSVRPELQSHIGKETENNMLHYKKTSEYSLREYTIRLLDTMQDNDKKLDSVIKDLYFYGNLLNRKYELMKIAFRFFYIGIALAILAYLIILLFFHEGLNQPKSMIFIRALFMW